MKKFEPFSYINEKNITRLADMFMLHKDQPWVMAIVIGYLRPDFTRMVLSSLPAEAQGKLALAFMTVRQVTREQVIAIDNEFRGGLGIVKGRMQTPESDFETRIQDEAVPKGKPFSYICEHDIKRLAYMFMLRKKQFWEMAVVVRHLPPDFARMALSSLPAEMQGKLAFAILTVKHIPREQEIALDNEVRESVDFVMGGMEMLAFLLDAVDSTTRSNILDYLKNEKPAVYQRARKFILSFDDIGDFPDSKMQAIVPELSNESMARALQNCAFEVMDKFLSNMSPEEASWLKESMDHAKGLTTSQIQEERDKIVAVVKMLEKEGRIAARERPDEGVDLEDFSVEERASLKQAIAGDSDASESPNVVAGDIELLASMLDEIDSTTRSNVLAYLKNEKPAAYKRVRKSILSFDDIGDLPDSEMQAIVRELKIESMARALQNCAPEVMDKFLSNMPPGEATLLKEAMDFNLGITTSQIEDERVAMMKVVKGLKKEGTPRSWRTR